MKRGQEKPVRSTQCELCREAETFVVELQERGKIKEKMIALFISLNVCSEKEGNKVYFILTEDERKAITLKSKKKNLNLCIRKGFLTINVVNTEICLWGVCRSPPCFHQWMFLKSISEQ